jgi:hypothetical protein
VAADRIAIDHEGRDDGGAVEGRIAVSGPRPTAPRQPSSGRNGSISMPPRYARSRGAGRGG